MDKQTQYHYYKVDFMSAYRNNGGDVELALWQVASLRGLEIESLRTTLRDLIKKLKQ